jgi:cardiolipin synthase
MEQQYLQDLENATEVVLDARHKVRSPGEPRHPVAMSTSGGGSAGRAAAGALRIGNAVGAAFTNRRVLQPVERGLMFGTGLLLLALAILFYLFPHAASYPLIVLLGWTALALIYRSYKLGRDRRKKGTNEGTSS